ncbi:MAG: hypothetical protein ACXQTU_05000 [Candidatus Nezhaarchaeales archaeon]
MLKNKAISSMIGIMIMAIMLSFFIMLFSSLSFSFINYATTLHQELDMTGDIAAEEKLAITASTNTTHIILTLTNNAPREVEIPYAYFKHNNSFHIEKVNIKIPSSTTIQVALPSPIGYVDPSLKTFLIAKRGSIYKISLMPQLTTEENCTKIPYEDMYLINDVDIVDNQKGLVVAAYKNGGVLMINVEKSSIIWSKEFLQAKTENVMYNEALNATLASIASANPHQTKTLSVIALRGGFLLSLNNFYDYKIFQFPGTPTIKEITYQAAIAGRNQKFIMVPKSFFSANYSTNDYWIYSTREYVNIIDSNPAIVKEHLLQSALILDRDTTISPSQYQKNPNIFPKLKVVGYVALNNSFGVILVEKALYNGGNIVYEKIRCNTVKTGSGILIPPTLHAISNGSLKWYRSLYPCDLSLPSFLACINNTVIVSSGPYLYLLNTNGYIIKMIDYSPEKIIFLKHDEHYDKLIIQFTNNTLLILNSSFITEKTILLNSQIVEAVLVNPSRIIVFNETHAYDPENPSSFMVKLPSKPYKVIKIGIAEILVATDHGLLRLRA